MFYLFISILCTNKNKYDMGARTPAGSCEHDAPHDVNDVALFHFIYKFYFRYQQTR